MCWEHIIENKLLVFSIHKSFKHLFPSIPKNKMFLFNNGACRVGGQPIIFGRLHVLFYEYDRINYQHQYYYFRVCSNKYYYLLKKKSSTLVI